MPVHKVKGGYRWGSKGKVYKSKKEAAKQGQAAYANGYRGDMPKPAQPADPMQPMPPPADPPKSTQNTGGQPMSMPTAPASSWGNTLDADFFKK